MVDLGIYSLIVQYHSVTFADTFDGKVNSEVVFVSETVVTPSCTVPLPYLPLLRVNRFYNKSFGLFIFDDIG